MLNGAQQGTTNFALGQSAPGFERSLTLDPMADVDCEGGAVTDIAAFLAKPMPVANGSFTTANVWGDLLYSSDLLTLFNAQTIWVNKIQGFLSFRGDVKLRFVFNPTPFQAGLLRASFIPFAVNNVPMANTHLYNRDTISQLPGAYYNLNDNCVELTIPYVSPSYYIERDVNWFPSWGSIYLHVMEILRTGTGPTSVAWTLWMSIENLELSGQVQPQMANGEPPARRRGRNHSDAEANGGKGTISTAFGLGSKLASTLSSIPLLTGVMGPAAWALNALSGAAASFGWSKPVATEQSHFHVLGNNQDSVTALGNYTGGVFAATPDNKISVISDAAPGEQDEMSFDFIKKVWSYWVDFQWATSGTAGTLLWSSTIGPSVLERTYTVSGQTCKTNASCALPMLFTEFYRGGFEVRVRIIKTGYHTGTLAIVFCPGQNPTTPSWNDTAYMYRSIIDIQEGSDYCFTLPYVLPQDYLSNVVAMGKFFVFVVNPLQAPATVAATCDVFLEIRGADDLEYQLPTNCKYTPFVPQGVMVESEGEVFCETLGSSAPSHNLLHSTLCIGESVKSLLQIAKMDYSLRWGYGYNARGKIAQFATHRFYAARYNGVRFETPNVLGDPISLIAACFALSRGSMRWRRNDLQSDYVVSSTNTENSGAYQVALFQENYIKPPVFSTATNVPLLSSLGGSSVYSAGDNSVSARIYQIPTVNNSVTVQFPFYCKFRYMLNYLVSADTSDCSAFFAPNQSAVLYNSGQYVNDKACLFLRSVGEDFQFSYYLGVPLYMGTGVAAIASNL